MDSRIDQALVIEPDWRERMKRQERCEANGHPLAYWHRRVHENGSIHIEFFCESCERPVTAGRYADKGAKGPWVSAEWFGVHVGSDPAELPLRTTSLRMRLCYLCGVTSQCEYHHVAPQAIYGSDAEKYPCVALCKRCHDQATKDFSERLERYVADRIKRYLAKHGGSAKGVRNTPSKLTMLGEYCNLSKATD